MSLLDQLNADLISAQKAKDEVATSTLRMAISNLKNARIAKGGDLTDDDSIAELVKDAKRHKESIAVFTNAGRLELATKEKAELDVLSKYLPEQISEDEIKKAVDEAVSEVKPGGVADMGKVMSVVMSKVGRGADGSVVSSLVREKLSAL
ncbi:MAG TPA: GatB/YqeY domain-containing protein [Candidatus Saccharimonadales bacterium]|nr:GatB/YqeY domain-containing protein [Candidatus Saccharimonadales bacterium]